LIWLGGEPEVILEDAGTAALSRRNVMVGSGAAALAACSRHAPASISGAQAGTLEWAVGGDWRPREDRARDRWRHPLESLRFWGLKPGATVVEFWPGAGWFTDIIAPFLTSTHGALYAANLETDSGGPAAREIVEAFKRKLAARPDLYRSVTVTAFGPRSGPVAPAGSADTVLFLRNLHNWMAAGLAEKAFHDALAALKPGGVLGVEEHRAPPGGVQDVLASSGYVQEAYVKEMAKEAGFTFAASSEVNANPKDDRNHPFGVWTLPPTRLSAPRGQPADPAFDHRPYDAIGESDRMTLKFVKPG
jgi:predicted methyltransferase